MRTLFHHANRNGWLIDSTIMPLALTEPYAKSSGGNTATITEEQHLKIVGAIKYDLENWDGKIKRMQRRDEELLLEVKSILEVLWELGSSNADARELSTSNINWETGHVVFKRKKWKGTGAKNRRTRQAIHFPMSAKLKEVIRPWYDDAMKNGGGDLFPLASKTQSGNVTRIFNVYMEVAGVPKFAADEDGHERKLIIHSYRYRMAEHLFEIGATEAEAKALMGWQSREVMLAYAKGMNMKIPALDVMAKERGEDKIIPMEKVA